MYFVLSKLLLGTIERVYVQMSLIEGKTSTKQLSAFNKPPTSDSKHLFKALVWQSTHSILYFGVEYSHLYFIFLLFGLSIAVQA